MGITQETIGKRLQKARKKSGYSQEKAADVVDLDRSAISRIENGKQQISSLQLKKLCDLYGVDMHYLFREPDEENELTFIQALRQYGEEQSGTEFRDVQKIETFCRQYVHLKEKKEELEQ